ncbi:myoneurin [Aethina tumida]|uniref:myoneurin n=1 Tax=Aethina tumida TaxID=116153 RepID=UPI002147F1A0|nr:myoneurin [Aethina tumida]
MDDNNTMTFHSVELSSSMFQKLYEQKKSNRFCDLTLYVNNKIIKAHRNVLACSSPYFDSILKHHKVIREQLSVTCLDSEIFNTILNYMYTGEITIEHTNVEELLKLADHFILTKVIEYCIEFLGTKLNLENCLFTYFLTQRFKLKHLGNIVENWIVSHIDEICKGEEIVNLSPNELQEFFKNKSFVLTTSKSLSVLSQWVLMDVEKREKDFDRLIKCFPTNNLEPAEVFKHLDTNILYTKSELCLYRFLDYLVVNNWMLSNFKTRYDVLQVKYGQMASTPVKDHEVKFDKIIVTEKNDSNSTDNYFSSVMVKAKLKNRKQLILKRLMLFGLKPSLRMAALKMLTCKKKKISLTDEEVEEEPEEKERESVKCPICFTTINDSLLLEQHLALSHAKDVTYKCGICSFVCQYHGDYLNHMKTHFTGPPFKCDYCDYTSDQIGKLISHRAQHLEESIFQCTFCSFKCRIKQNYEAHVKIHSPEKAFKCEHCTKSFRLKQNLESHLLSHTSEKNLTCDSCGFHTKYLSHMIAHKRIHAADRYRCSYPHCQYTTSKKNQLASHAKSHNGVRPHTCGVCGRGFMEKSHLVRHERIHLEEKPFKCSNCDYASSRRDKLKEHFTRHHGENASAKVPYKARPLRNNNSSRPKSQSNQETTTTTNSSNNINFTQTNSTTSAPVTQPIGSEIQDLIMHHQNHSISSAASNLTAINSNYHHFGESGDFHHHNHAHNIHNQILASGHNQRNSSSQHHNNNIVNHHMLARSNHSTATSTAAAVAAAMMLDPRFHHNSSVPYHPSTTPVSMAMAAVQSSQQIQASGQHSDYPPNLQNCMTLF